MGHVARSSLPGSLRALAYRDFRYLWLASLVSLVSFFMVLIARGWLVLERTDSAFLVTAVSAISMVPMFFFSAFGGAIADRLNRRTILILGELANFVILLVQGLLLVANLLETWHLFALALLNGIAFSLMHPARSALVPNVVGPGEITSGVVLYSTIFSVSQLIGPALAGYIIHLTSMSITFLVPAFLLVPAVALVMPLRVSQARVGAGQNTSGSIMRSLFEGWLYVWHRQVFLGLMLLGLVGTFFGIPYNSLLPVFARDVLDVGADGLGLLAALAGVGGIVGGFTIAFFSSPRQLRYLVFLGGIGMGLAIVLFALSTEFVLSLALVALVGFMLHIFLTSNVALVQVACPDYIRGRVMGMRMIVMGVGPLGMVLLGAGAELLSPATSMALMGAIGVILTVAIGLAMPALREAEVAVEEEAAGLADN